MPQNYSLIPLVPYSPEWHVARYAWGLNAARSVGEELDARSRNVYEEAIWRATWKERYGSEPNRRFRPRHHVSPTRDTTTDITATDHDPLVTAEWTEVCEYVTTMRLSEWYEQLGGESLECGETGGGALDSTLAERVGPDFDGCYERTIRCVYAA